MNYLVIYIYEEGGGHGIGKAKVNFPNGLTYAAIDGFEDEMAEKIGADMVGVVNIIPLAD